MSLQSFDSSERTAGTHKVNTRTRILIADDDCDDSDILCEVLKELKAGHKVWCFDDPMKAYHFLDALTNEELPTLIIVDFNMPMINGLQMLYKLKGLHRFDAIPKIIYSGRLLSTDVVECKEAGATACIDKSNTIDQIREDVRQMLTYCK